MTQEKSQRKDEICWKYSLDKKKVSIVCLVSKLGKEKKAKGEYFLLDQIGRYLLQKKP